jgi:hypothetical protein
VRNPKLTRRVARTHPVPIGKTHLQIQFDGENAPALPAEGRPKGAEFYSASSGTIPPRPWQTFPPPFSALSAAGFLAMSGHIIDASIVAAPKQRNTDGET